MDEVILLSEAEIAAGMALAFRELRLVLEGGAAIGLAALLARPHLRQAGPTVLPLTGTGVDADEALEAIRSVPQRALVPAPAEETK
jgi:threonine dehydratase